MLGVDLPQTQVFSPLRQQVEAVMIAVGLVSSVLRLRVCFDVVCEVAVVAGMKLCCECAVVIEGERSDAEEAFLYNTCCVIPPAQQHHPAPVFTGQTPLSLPKQAVRPREDPVYLRLHRAGAPMLQG